MIKINRRNFSWRNTRRMVSCRKKNPAAQSTNFSEAFGDQKAISNDQKKYFSSTPKIHNKKNLSFSKSYFYQNLEEND